MLYTRMTSWVIRMAGGAFPALKQQFLPHIDTFANNALICLWALIQHFGASSSCGVLFCLHASMFLSSLMSNHFCSTSCTLQFIARFSSLSTAETPFLWLLNNTSGVVMNTGKSYFFISTSAVKKFWHLFLWLLLWFFMKLVRINYVNLWCGRFHKQFLQ